MWPWPSRWAFPWAAQWGGREEGKGFLGHSSLGAPGMRLLLFSWVQCPGKRLLTVQALSRGGSQGRGERAAIKSLPCAGLRAMGGKYVNS